METSVRAHRLFARGCYSETGHLRKVVMCPPTFFRILEPINAVQSLYYSDGLPKPEPLVMVQQHKGLVDTLRTEDVEIEFLSPTRNLPYQHATRDVGVVIGDTIVLSNLKENTRRLETQAIEPTRYGVRCHRFGSARFRIRQHPSSALCRTPR